MCWWSPWQCAWLVEQPHASTCLCPGVHALKCQRTPGAAGGRRVLQRRLRKHVRRPARRQATVQAAVARCNTATCGRRACPPCGRQRRPVCQRADASAGKCRERVRAHSARVHARRWHALLLQAPACAAVEAAAALCSQAGRTFCGAAARPRARPARASGCLTAAHWQVGTCRQARAHGGGGCSGGCSQCELASVLVRVECTLHSHIKCSRLPCASRMLAANANAAAGKATALRYWPFSFFFFRVCCCRHAARLPL